MINARDYAKYLFVALFIFVIYLSYLVVKPFVTAILASAILAYIFHPFYRKLNKKIRKKNLSAFIVSILIILLIATPFFFLLNSMVKESQFVYIKTKQILTTGDLLSIGCAQEDKGLVCSASNKIAEFLSKPKVRYHLDDSMKKLTSAISQKSSELVYSIPTILLNIFVTFFATFYFFKDGKEIMEKIKGLMPLKLHHQKQMFQQLNETAYAIIYGSLLIAAVQGAVGAIGFWIFGVSSPITWGIAMAIFALLPFVGTAIIWLPISFFVIVQGLSIGSNTAVAKGVGLLLFCALIVSSMDNLLKPYLIGRKANIHPVLILLGVLGGLAFFGFIGFIIGPLILALLVTLLQIYEKEREEGNGLKQ